MNHDNCVSCYAIFIKNNDSDKICSKCKILEMNVISSINNYIKKNSSLMLKNEDITNQFEINKETLFGYIRNGKLLLYPNHEIGFDCYVCGDFTKTIQICAKCAKK